MHGYVLHAQIVAGGSDRRVEASGLTSASIMWASRELLEMFMGVCVVLLLCYIREYTKKAQATTIIPFQRDGRVSVLPDADSMGRAQQLLHD